MRGGSTVGTPVLRTCQFGCLPLRASCDPLLSSPTLRHVSLSLNECSSSSVVVMLQFALWCRTSLRASAKAFGRATGWWVPLQARWVANGWHVSSYGRVKSSKGVISLGSSHGGYYYVFIARQNFYVHRLVAAAFLGPSPHKGPWQVNHMDGDSANNRAINLEYVTPAENVQHSYLTRPHRASRPGKAVLWRQVGAEVWNICSSRAQAAALLGVDRSLVSSCCRGVIRSCFGNGLRYEFSCAAPEEPPCEEGEVWLPARQPGDIAANPELMVSNHGRVFFRSMYYQHTTRGSRTKEGYYKISAQNQQIFVHRLVAATFLGQPDTLSLRVNHKDGDRGNNRPQNLEYVTASENLLHARRNDAIPQKRKGKTVLARQVSDNGGWTTFESIRAAAIHTGLSWQRITNSCDGLDSSITWEFKFPDETLDGEEWRPVVLEGARTPKDKM